MRFPMTKLGCAMWASGAILAAAGTPAWAQMCWQQKLNHPNAVANERFGQSVSISGDRIVVGAERHEDEAGNVIGAAYVFRRDDRGTPLDPSDDFWVEEDRITASDPAYNYFGSSVSISGDRTIVGAYRGEAAYIFRRDDSGTPLDPSDDFWVEEAKLTASDAAVDVYFGQSVSISGDQAVVGAPFDDDACPGDPLCKSGSAYVFRRDDNGTPSDPSDDFWSQEAKLIASDDALGDQFGHSVSISSDRLVVGAYRDDDACPGDPECDSGAVYVFQHKDGEWVEEVKLTASDTAEIDVFGASVALDGDAIVVGARGNDDGGSASGSAYVFHRNGASWVEEAKLTASDAAGGDRFGHSVSISGDQAVVGAFFDDDACPDDSYCNSGSVYVFRRDDSGTPSDPSDDFWVEHLKLTASDAAEGDDFGWSVSTSGGWAVAGAPYKNDAAYSSGSAYVLDVPETTTPCDDGDACTENDISCPRGVCAGTPLTCDDGNICTTAGCDPSTGCLFTPNMNRCDDGDLCTKDDTCSEEVCAGISRVVPFGDVSPPGGNGVVDIDDVVRLLYAFAAPYPCVSYYPGMNLVPCGQECEDGEVDIDDLLAVLAAYAGDYICPHPCPP